MKRYTHLVRIAIVGVFIVCVAALQIHAQDTKKPEVEKGVFWADAATGTQVYLSNGGRLTVISKKAARVDYHTKINSSVPVDKRLVQTGSTGPTVTYFKVDHHFSRTTIWMTLEFTVGRKKVPALTRTFYNSIFETVPTEQFYDSGGKLQP